MSEINDYVDGDVNAVDSYDEEASADTAVATLSTSLSHSVTTRVPFLFPLRTVRARLFSRSRLVAMTWVASLVDAVVPLRPFAHSLPQPALATG